MAKVGIRREEKGEEYKKGKEQELSLGFNALFLSLKSTAALKLVVQCHSNDISRFKHKHYYGGMITSV